MRPIRLLLSIVVGATLTQAANQNYDIPAYATEWKQDVMHRYYDLSTAYAISGTLVQQANNTLWMYGTLSNNTNFLFMKTEQKLMPFSSEQNRVYDNQTTTREFWCVVTTNTTTHDLTYGPCWKCREVIRTDPVSGSVYYVTNTFTDRLVVTTMADLAYTGCSSGELVNSSLQYYEDDGYTLVKDDVISSVSVFFTVDNQWSANPTVSLHADTSEISYDDGGVQVTCDDQEISYEGTKTKGQSYTLSYRTVPQNQNLEYLKHAYRLRVVGYGQR